MAADLSCISSLQSHSSVFVDFIVVDDDCCWAERCWVDSDRAVTFSDRATADDAEACSCIARLFIHADVIGPCVGISDTARSYRAEGHADTSLVDLAGACVDSLAIEEDLACVASLAIEEDLAYLSRSSVASYRLPWTHFFANRSLNVRAPGVSPLVPLSVSR